MELIFRPIEQWPGKMTATRKRSVFRASYGGTLSLLDTELRHLGAREIFVQAALTHEDIRLDGRPRKDARPSHPGVILTFQSKYGPLQYPCDRFDAWEDNLRAIALSLQHLRAVDRYGVTRRGEQYRGWEQLPNKTAAMSPQQALKVLAPFGPVERPEDIETAYRRGAKELHPDRGGNAQMFNELVAAHETLTKPS